MKFHALILAVLALALPGCALMPDHYTAVVRTGNRVGIQGMNLGVVYDNPWKRHGAYGAATP